MSRRRAFSMRAVTILGCLAIWYLLGRSGISTLKLPRISAVVSVLAEHPNELLEYGLTTLFRVFSSLVLGGVTGWIVGLAFSQSALLRSVLEPLLELLRPIPPLVLIPFAILWLGLGTLSQLLVIGLGVFMVLMIGTFEAACNLPERFILAARSLGATTPQVTRRIVVPAIRPQLLGPIRVAICTAFGLAVAAEYLGAQGGLGYLIRNARTTLNTDVIAAASIALGIEAIAIDTLVRWLWSATTQWTDRQRYSHTVIT